MEGQGGVNLTVDDDVEGGGAVIPAEVLPAAICRMIQAKGKQGQTLQRVHGAGIVSVGDDVAVGRYQLGEAAEGVLDVVQIFEKVQMVGIYIQHHCHSGEKVEKAVAVFAGFQDNGISFAHPVAAVEHGEGAADHNGRICVGGHKNVSGHGGGSGFAVGAGNAHRVFVSLHNGAPGFCPFKNRDTLLVGRGDFGVVIMDGGGTDQKFRPFNVLGAVAHSDRDTQAPQVLHSGAVLHVTALDLQAHAVQDLCQRTHGNAADTREVDPAAGNDIGLDFGIDMGHGTGSFPNGFWPVFAFFAELYYTISAKALQYGIPLLLCAFSIKLYACL